MTGLSAVGRWTVAGCPEDLEQCVATGGCASQQPSNPPPPSMLALMTNHSVVFAALGPINKQYLGMVDVDVVVQMIHQSNQHNGGAVINLLLDWYEILGENQLCDDIRRS